MKISKSKIIVKLVLVSCLTTQVHGSFWWIFDCCLQPKVETFEMAVQTDPISSKSVEVHTNPTTWEENVDRLGQSPKPKDRINAEGMRTAAANFKPIIISH